MIWIRILSTSVLLLVGGCASMTVEECLTADWRTVGYEDGFRGIGGEGIERHRRACAKAGVTPDFDVYQAGRQEGLRQFCRPAKGYALGRRGQHYGGVCPEDLEAAFLGGYDDGLEVHRFELDVFAIENDIARIDSLIHEAEDDVADREEVLDGEDVGQAERKELRSEIRDLVEYITELRRDRAILVNELVGREGTLRALLRQHAHYRS